MMMARAGLERQFIQPGFLDWGIVACTACDFSIAMMNTRVYDSRVGARHQRLLFSPTSSQSVQIWYLDLGIWSGSRYQICTGFTGFVRTILKTRQRASPSSISSLCYEGTIRYRDGTIGHRDGTIGYRDGTLTEHLIHLRVQRGYTHGTRTVHSRYTRGTLTVHSR
jgi:hypothetical protein